ncbi:MAG: glycoside hydrolase family 16 protein, partial [Paludibacter sp.]
PAENRVLEIDGFELDSKHNVLGQNYHIYTPSQKTQGPKPNHVEKDLSKWITMGYEWLPDRINYYADGVHFATKELNGIWKVYAPQNFWLTALPVNMASWGGLKIPPSDAAMQVDYFRFYARKLKAVNRVGNPGFEYGKIGNTYPVAWIVARTNGYNPEAIKVVSDSSTTYEGRCYLQFKIDKPCKALARQVIEYIPNGIYSFSAYVKSSGGQNSASIVIKSGAKEQILKIPITNLWTKISLDKIVVKGNNAIIEIQTKLDVNQTIKMDEFEFIEIR